jgi:hypothetical protein
MVNYLQWLHHHRDIFSGFRSGKSTKTISEALERQLTVDQQEELDSDPDWNNLSAVAKHCCDDEEKIQTESEIA